MESQITRHELLKIINENLTNILTLRSEAINVLEKIKEELDKYGLGNYFQYYYTENEIISEITINSNYNNIYYEFEKIKHINNVRNQIYMDLLPITKNEEKFTDEDIKNIVLLVFSERHYNIFLDVSDSNLNVLYSCFGIENKMEDAIKHLNSAKELIKYDTINNKTYIEKFLEFLIEDIKGKMFVKSVHNYLEKEQSEVQIFNNEEEQIKKENLTETQELSLDDKIKIIKEKIKKLEELSKQEKDLKSNLESIKVKQQEILDDINTMKL